MEQCSKCEEYGHFDYQCPFKSRHVNIVPSNDVDNSKVVEEVRVPTEISSIVEEPLVNPGAPIIDESHVSSVDIIDTVDVSVECSTPMSNNIIVPEDEPSESITLHLSVTYDETPR